ncbi:uncharacterized protein [Dysidea avara]|uniref:uncharacterized protein n=1 Tax=Dysidea avara TaxID=196820 RepID=UPI0033206FED
MCDARIVVQDKKLYVAGGTSPVNDAIHLVYVYDINTDFWGQLPPPGHYNGVPQIIGGKLAIIGGCLSATGAITNKVSTFDETSQTWTSYYPDLLSVRNKPGVVIHLEHVIVAGGVKKIDSLAIHNDIEVLDWTQNVQWKMVSIHLPVPMFGFRPIIAENCLVIVGYADADLYREKIAYKIPVTYITRSNDLEESSIAPVKWITLTAATHWYANLVPNSYPPVVVGGHDQNGSMPTADIQIYEDSSKSWRNIALLSSAKTRLGIAAVNDSAIIVLGGCTKSNSPANVKSSSLSTVELGQAQINKH